MAYQLPSTMASDLKAGAYRDPRVSFFLQPGEELVQCAYDKSHWVLTTKITTHLVKCRHNYLNAVRKGTIKVTEGSEMVPCAFNMNHHMPQSEMENHLKNVCESNPYRTDFFKMMDAEKARRDRIAKEEAEELKAAKAGGGAASGRPGDPGAGPYGDAKNSGPGFWGTKKNPNTQEGQVGDEAGVKMETEHDEKPEVEGAVGGAVGGHVKQEMGRGLDVNMKVKEEAAAGNQGGGGGGSICGSRASSTSGAAAAAALLKTKKEEERLEKEREHRSRFKFVRPGPFGSITTPYTHYKDMKTQVKPEPEPRDEHGFTEAQSKDPNYNWELCPPAVCFIPGAGESDRFSSYDPDAYMKWAELQGVVYIQNPQGLTKSEKKAWRARQAELLMLERPDAEAREEEKDKKEKEEESRHRPDLGDSMVPDRALAIRATRIKEREDREKEAEKNLDDVAEPPVIAGRRVRNWKRGQVRPGCPGFELNLDMQENPVEEYEKWSESGSLVSSGARSTGTGTPK